MDLACIWLLCGMRAARSPPCAYCLGRARIGLRDRGRLDAEYRYDRAPVGALQGLAPDRVVYAGSTSRILAPALRLGWLVVPASLVRVTAEIKKWSDLGSSFIEQLVLAAFLQEGSLDRHLRRMRHVYRLRRDALLDALARHCTEWTP